MNAWFGVSARAVSGVRASLSVRGKSARCKDCVHRCLLVALGWLWTSDEGRFVEEMLGCRTLGLRLLAKACSPGGFENFAGHKAITIFNAYVCAGASACCMRTSARVAGAGCTHKNHRRSHVQTFLASL